MFLLPPAAACTEHTQKDKGVMRLAFTIQVSVLTRTTGHFPMYLALVLVYKYTVQPLYRHSSCVEGFMITRILQDCSERFLGAWEYLNATKAEFLDPDKLS